MCGQVTIKGPDPHLLASSTFHRTRNKMAKILPNTPVPHHKSKEISALPIYHMINASKISKTGSSGISNNIRRWEVESQEFRISTLLPKLSMKVRQWNSLADIRAARSQHVKNTRLIRLMRNCLQPGSTFTKLVVRWLLPIVRGALQL